MISLSLLLQQTWNDYCALNPDAKRIHALFSEREKTVENDHIALRTFDFPKMNMKTLARTFENYGYEEKGQYTFTEKKLDAKHYEHADTSLPKIFISELRTYELGETVQKTLQTLTENVPVHFFEDPTWFMKGRPWEVDMATYDSLAAVSEYASWVAAHGFRPNHFTVNVNALTSFHSLEEVNQFIRDHGFRLNSSGGEIKGTKDVYLEQSSTMANEIEVRFSDGSKKIPACYYEFARRYPMKNGKLYQGFVATSADKIFESTNKVKVE